MHSILQIKLVLVILPFLFIMACKSDPESAEIERLQNELDRLKEVEVMNQQFVDNLTTEFQSIQLALDSIYQSEQMLPTGGLSENIPPLQKILLLDSLLSQSQKRINQLTQEVNKQGGSSISQAGELLINQLQKQVIELRNELSLAYQENKNISQQLAQTSTTLAQTTVQLQQTKEQQEQNTADYIAAMAQTEREKQVLRQKNLDAQTQLEQANALRIFSEGKAYFEALNTLISERGRIKRSDKAEAERLANLAMERFTQAARLGYSEANDYKAKLNYQPVYQDLLRKPAGSVN